MPDSRPAAGARRRRLTRGAWIACRSLGALLATLPPTLVVIGGIRHDADLLFPAGLLTPACALWSIPFFLAAGRIRRGEPRGAALASRACGLFSYFGIASLGFGLVNDHGWFVLTGVAALCLAGTLAYVFRKTLVTLDQASEDSCGGR